MGCPTRAAPPRLGTLSIPPGQDTQGAECVPPDARPGHFGPWMRDPTGSHPRQGIGSSDYCGGALLAQCREAARFIPRTVLGADFACAETATRSWVRTRQPLAASRCSTANSGTRWSSLPLDHCGKSKTANIRSDTDTSRATASADANSPSGLERLLDAVEGCCRGCGVVRWRSQGSGRGRCAGAWLVEGKCQPVAGCVLHEQGYEVSNRVAGELEVRHPNRRLHQSRVQAGVPLAQPLTHAGQGQPLVLLIHCPRIGEQHRRRKGVSANQAHGCEP